MYYLARTIKQTKIKLMNTKREIKNLEHLIRILELIQKCKNKKDIIKSNINMFYSVQQNQLYEKEMKNLEFIIKAEQRLINYYNNKKIEL